MRDGGGDGRGHVTASSTSPLRPGLHVGHSCDSHSLEPCRHWLAVLCFSNMTILPGHAVDWYSPVICYTTEAVTLWGVHLLAPICRVYVLPRFRPFALFTFPASLFLLPCFLSCKSPSQPCLNHTHFPSSPL